MEEKMLTNSEKSALYYWKCLNNESDKKVTRIMPSYSYQTKDALMWNTRSTLQNKSTPPQSTISTAHQVRRKTRKDHPQNANVCMRTP